MTTRRKSRRVLTVVPVYATDPDAPSLAELQVQALPALTRLFVSAIRKGRESKTPERA
jgi:hypothetical protein